jgi:hypothetical protein
MHARPISSSAAQVPEDGLAAEDLGQHPIAVLSATVLKAARAGCGMSLEYFARLSGVSVAEAEAVEAGAHPAWALPFDHFSALSDAVSAISPWMNGMFETATACDLLLSCVLDGDQTFATDVLATPETRELATALLRLVMTGQLLTHAQISLLAENASALSMSTSPDAWVGTELLAIWRGDL